MMARMELESALDKQKKADAEGYYKVSRTTIEKVLKALGDNCFSSDGEEDYNNDSVIEADQELQAEIKRQEEI